MPRMHRSPFGFNLCMAKVHAALYLKQGFLCKRLRLSFLPSAWALDRWGTGLGPPDLLFRQVSSSCRLPWDAVARNLLACWAAGIRGPSPEPLF